MTRLGLTLTWDRQRAEAPSEHPLLQLLKSLHARVLQLHACRYWLRWLLLCLLVAFVLGGIDALTRSNAKGSAWVVALPWWLFSLGSAGWLVGWVRRQAPSLAHLAHAIEQAQGANDLPLTSALAWCCTPLGPGESAPLRTMDLNRKWAQLQAWPWDRMLAPRPFTEELRMLVVAGSLLLIAGLLSPQSAGIAAQRLLFPFLAPQWPAEYALELVDYSQRLHAGQTPWVKLRGTGRIPALVGRCRTTQRAWTESFAWEQRTAGRSEDSTGIIPADVRVFTFQPVHADLEMRLQVGSWNSPPLRVQIHKRPRLIHLQSQFVPPANTQRDLMVQSGNQWRAPAGSQLQLQAKVDLPLQALEWIVEAPPTAELPAHSRGEELARHALQREAADSPGPASEALAHAWRLQIPLPDRPNVVWRLVAKLTDLPAEELATGTLQQLQDQPPLAELRWGLSGMSGTLAGAWTPGMPLQGSARGQDDHRLQSLTLELISSESVAGDRASLPLTTDSQQVGESLVEGPSLGKETTAVAVNLNLPVASATAPLTPEESLGVIWSRQIWTNPRTTLRRGTAPADSWLLELNLAPNELPTLSPEVNYQWRLVAQDSAGQRGVSAEVPFKPLLPAELQNLLLDELTAIARQLRSLARWQELARVGTPEGAPKELASRLRGSLHQQRTISRGVLGPRGVSTRVQIFASVARAQPGAWQVWLQLMEPEFGWLTAECPAELASLEQAVSKQLLAVATDPPPGSAASNGNAEHLAGVSRPTWLELDTRQATLQQRWIQIARQCERVSKDAGDGMAWERWLQQQSDLYDQCSGALQATLAAENSVGQAATAPRELPEWAAAQSELNELLYHLLDALPADRAPLAIRMRELAQSATTAFQAQRLALAVEAQGDLIKQAEALLAELAPQSVSIPVWEETADAAEVPLTGSDGLPASTSDDQELAQQEVELLNRLLNLQTALMQAVDRQTRLTEPWVGSRLQPLVDRQRALSGELNPWVERLKQIHGVQAEAANPNELDNGPGLIGSQVSPVSPAEGAADVVEDPLLTIVGPSNTRPGQGSVHIDILLADTVLLRMAEAAQTLQTCVKLAEAMPSPAGSPDRPLDQAATTKKLHREQALSAQQTVLASLRALVQARQAAADPGVWNQVAANGDAADANPENTLPAQTPPTGQGLSGAPRDGTGRTERNGQQTAAGEARAEGNGSSQAANAPSGSAGQGGGVGVTVIAEPEEAGLSTSAPRKMVGRRRLLPAAAASLGTWEPAAFDPRYAAEILAYQQLLQATE